MRTLSIAFAATALGRRPETVAAFPTPLAPRCPTPSRATATAPRSRLRTRVALSSASARSRPDRRLPPLRATVHDAKATSGVNGVEASGEEHDEKHHNLLSQAYHLYVDYFDRLWSETAVDQRRKVARRRARDAVLHVRDLSHEGGPALDAVDVETLAKMEEACNEVLGKLEKSKGGEVVEEATVEAAPALKAEQTPAPEESHVNGEEVVAPVAVSPDAATAPARKKLVVVENMAVEDVRKIAEGVALDKKKGKKGGRSVLFGAAMGLAVAGWVYSGNYVFTALFTLMTALGQLEYYRMVMQTGIYPARRISVLGACATFLTALFAPDLHQIVLPVAATWAMVWFLTMRRGVTTISEIATTFTGMFYLGYIPSFWVRIRQLGAGIVQPTRLAPLVKPLLNRLGQKKLPAFLPKTIHYPITRGSNFIFWTWLCIAFSDVGGYFAGRRFGKTKLGAISPAAGKTSPNKTVEGVVGGCAFSMALATLGAWVQHWPYWAITGPIHGVMLALLGLVGDLTASMLKRDAGLKDFGDLIPEHGGIMDRVDSYVFTAPYGWIVCGYVIPWLKRVADGRVAAAAAAALVV